MLCRSQHQLNFTALLLDVICLFKKKKTNQRQTNKTNTTKLCRDSPPKTPGGHSHVAGCSGHRRCRTCAVRGAAAPTTLCEPELWCEPELLHFLPLCCFVLFHCWLARPPPSPRQRMHPEFSVFLFSESLPYFLLFRL